MKCGADLNTTGGILSPASGLTVQQVVLTLRLEKGLLLVISTRIAPGCATFPGGAGEEEKRHLLDLTVRISKQPLVEPVGLLIMDTGLMVKFVEEKKNASPSLFFFLKNLSRKNAELLLKPWPGAMKSTSQCPEFPPTWQISDLGTPN